MIEQFPLVGVDAELCPVEQFADVADVAGVGVDAFHGEP